MAKGKKRDFKAMFAQHIEKGVLGIAVFGMIYFAMTSFKKGIDENQTPDKLNDLAKTAQAHIDRAVGIAGTPAADAFVSINIGKVMDDISKPVQYPPFVPLDRQPFQHVQKRAMPTFFAVEDLHVTSVVASILLNDEQAANAAKFAQAKTQADKEANEKKKLEALQKLEESRRGSKGGKGGDGGNRPPQIGGKQRPDPLATNPGGKSLGPTTPVEIEPPHPYEKMEGGRKVEVVNMGIITGLIPYKKLYQSYFESLIKDKDNDLNHPADLDEPRFTGLLVERAQITDPNMPVDKLNWQNLSGPLAGWYSVRGDRLEFDPETLVPMICDPGKLTNLPTRPLPERATFVMTPMPRLANQLWGRNALHPRIPLAADVSKAETEKMASQVTLGTNAAPDPVISFGARGANAVAPQAINPNQPPVEPEEVLEYMMFRCIDPFQKPGEKYRYRVTLTYLNPNYLVDKSKVEDPQTTANPEIAGITSEPSPVSTAPLEEKLLVTKVLPAKRPGDSPKVDEFWYWKVGYTGTIDRNTTDPNAIALDSAGRTGGEVAKAFTNVNLGDIFAHVDKIPVLYNHLTSTSEEIDKHHFNLNQAYLVDVHGGDKTSKTAVDEQPEMLYSDANGQLHVSRALRDQVTIENFKKRYAKTDGTNPGVGTGRSRRGEEGEDPLLRPGRGGKL